MVRVLWELQLQRTWGRETISRASQASALRFRKPEGEARGVGGGGAEGRSVASHLPPELAQFPNSHFYFLGGRSVGETHDVICWQHLVRPVRGR